MQATNPDTAQARLLAAQNLSELKAQWAGVTAKPAASPPKIPKPRPAAYDVTNLKEVCKYGDIPALQQLMAVDSDLLAGDQDGISEAAENGQIEMLQFLLANGADLNAYNGYPLQTAARSGYIETVCFLLDKGADIQADRNLAIRWAAESNEYEIVTILLDKGAKYEVLHDTQKLAYADYLAQRLTSLAQLADINAAQSLSEIFKPATWTGHSREMVALWSEVPEGLQGGFDFQHALVEANIQTMKQRKPKITLVK